MRKASTIFSLIPRPLRGDGWHYFCWRCKTDLGPPSGVRPGEYNMNELREHVRNHIRAHRIEMRNQL